jgi:hypothetical protein
MKTVEKSEIMQRQWLNYQKDFEYASGIEFADVCETVVRVMNGLVEKID